jgi:hypothetical protein
MFTDRRRFSMGEKAQQATSTSARTPIPCVASLKVDDERLERFWALTPAERVQAAEHGQRTLGEMLRWAARAPRGEVPLVDGEFFFITRLSADAAESTGDARGFWEGEYTPLPDPRDVSRTMPAAAGDTSGERSC